MKRFVVLGLVIISIVFIYYGRSIYMPIINKVKEKNTVKTITDKLESKVKNNLKTHFERLHLDSFPSEILLIAYKEEQKLQVYTKILGNHELLKEYPFSASSGKLGPKLAEGDKQIPEGIYKIEYLNPNSSYYLSMKVNYPNTFDRKKGKSDGRTNLGSDIFIHGKSVTVGCIPVGDNAIEELFILVSKAMKKGVKVIISPRDFIANHQYPRIENIEWEEELYDIIYKELIPMKMRVQN